MQRTQSLEERRNAAVAQQEQAERQEIERKREEAMEDQRQRERAEKYDLWRVIQEAPQDFPIEAANWNLLIEMVEPKATMGRFLKTAAQIEQEQYLTVIGRVLKCGPTAFEGRTSSGIDCSKVAVDAASGAVIQTPAQLCGKYVIIQRYTGNDIYFAPYPAKKLRYITLQEVLGVTSVPTMFMKQ